MSAFDVAEPISAEAEAYNYILGKIRRGELRPGMRLKTEEIAGEIGMSRMPVRDAFGRLYQLGILTVRPNRGAVVTEFTADQIIELFEIRSVLEGLAIRRAAAFVTDRDIAELEDLLERMGRAENNLEQWLVRHGEFHAAIAQLSGGRRLAREIERMHLLLEVFLRVWMLGEAGPIDAMAEHAEVVEALKTRDPVKAETVMRNHVLSTAPAVAHALRSAG